VHALPPLAKRDDAKNAGDVAGIVISRGGEHSLGRTLPHLPLVWYGLQEDISPLGRHAVTCGDRYAALRHPATPRPATYHATYGARNAFGEGARTPPHITTTSILATLAHSPPLLAYAFYSASFRDYVLPLNSGADGGARTSAAARRVSLGLRAHISRAYTTCAST